MRAADNPRLYVEGLLALRMRSVGEVRRKLKEKGILLTEADALVDALLRAELLDDEAFTRQYVSSTIRNKQVGRLYLQQKLRARFIADDCITRALTELLSGEAERALAVVAVKKKQEDLARHGRRSVDHEKASRRRDNEARLFRFLVSRGFPSAIVVDVVREVLRADA